MVGKAQPLEAFIFGILLHKKEFSFAGYRIKDKNIISLK